jgi:hypothetical protein
VEASFFQLVALTGQRKHLLIGYKVRFSSPFLLSC